MIFKLYWWWFKRQNGYPCKNELRKAADYASSLGILSNRLDVFVNLYSIYSIEEVADKMNVTRERVRQILMKVVRLADKKSITHIHAVENKALWDKVRNRT